MIDLETIGSEAFASSVRANQDALRANLLSDYDYIVCGSGTAGSVVARRLAEDPSVSVLLLEAGGDDEAASVTVSALWPTNIGTERDWGFVSDPNPHLDGRSMALPMGKGLGGGSSINAMIWSRGHANDWAYFAAEAGDDAWSYEAALESYRQIEDWHGTTDPNRRGSGGLMYVQPSPNPHPTAGALLSSAARLGIPTFEDQNGALMEGPGGGALMNVTLREGKRASVFRSYVYPLMANSNLTVLTQATVLRVLTASGRATGVEVDLDGTRRRFGARRETVLSLGAINTPKILLLSGIGDSSQLSRLGIDLVQHLPGVGQNFQDHVMVAGCMWEAVDPVQPRNNLGAANLFWKSSPDLDGPDIQTIVAEIPLPTPETGQAFEIPSAAWTLLPGLVQPKSRGNVTLVSANPFDPARIETNTFSDPDDLHALVRAVETCREIGNDPGMQNHFNREAMPGNLKGGALRDFVRAATTTVWHPAGTAQMGHTPMSVVDGNLRVHGVEGLRIADASIMPRITTGNTMAPCIIIGERMASFLTGKSRLSASTE